MKNKYAEIRNILAKLDEVRAYHNRICSLNNGVISGGIDTSETGNEITALIERAEELVIGEIARRGCRLSHLKAICLSFGSSRSIQRLVEDAIAESAYQNSGF